MGGDEQGIIINGDGSPVSAQGSKPRIPSKVGAERRIKMNPETNPVEIIKTFGEAMSSAINTMHDATDEIKRLRESEIRLLIAGRKVLDGMAKLNYESGSNKQLEVAIKAATQTI